MDDSTQAEQDATQGNPEPVELNDKMMHDIQMLVARLVEKASQLLGNFTTNLAESLMHIRSKFDGGKVINRSQFVAVSLHGRRPTTKPRKDMGAQNME